ncbi:MAG TPA: cupin domain-containing protein [Anaeromyxobacter sp.]|nr:cupin domain-containing protein [Anaeromyxobacter sp.]
MGDSGESRPAWLVHADEVAEEEGHYRPPFDAEKLSFSRELGRATGAVQLGMSRERLPPGRRTSFTHAHSHEEEMVYVLEGECMLRLVEPGKPAREIPLRAGHCVTFLAGTGVGHCAWNRSDRDCLMLVVAARSAKDRVYYPEDGEFDAHVAANRPDRWWKR